MTREARHLLAAEPHERRPGLITSLRELRPPDYRGAMIRRRVVVHGDVQGVGYRYSCEHKARELGVAGWVRNREDGAVEAVFEGDPEAVEKMVAWTRSGPRFAGVTGVDVSDEALQGEHGFDIRF